MLKIKKNLSRICLLIIGIFLGFLISELIAGKYIKNTRLDEKLRYIEEKIGHYEQIDIGCYDEDLGWGLKPGTKGSVITSDFETTYAISSNGIRDKEISLSKTGDEFRIVALGESNVFGQGIDYGKRFTEVIEQELSNVEVVNMAVWGFGMDQAFLQLKRDGFKYEPDLVILFIIEDFLKRCKDFSNDCGYKPRFILSEDKSKLILQDINYFESNFGNQNISDTNNSSEEGSKKYSFLWKSKLLTLIHYYRKRKMIDGELKEQDRAYWKIILDEPFEKRRIEQDYYKQDFRKLIFLLLSKYKEICNAHKANFLLVNMDTCKIDYITDFCQDLDIFYLDLSDILTRVSKFASLRFDIDPHYNEFAHKVIGEHLSKYIKDKYDLGESKNYVYK